MFGVAEETHESSETTEKKAIQVFTDIGMNISPKDISACHCVSKPKDGKHAIIVQTEQRTYQDSLEVLNLLPV